MQKLTDDSLMTFGKYKGEKMANVPAKYLKWLYDEGKCSRPIKAYIIENLDVINQEIKNNDREKHN